MLFNVYRVELPNEGRESNLKIERESNGGSIMLSFNLLAVYTQSQVYLHFYNFQKDLGKRKRNTLSVLFLYC